MGGDSKNYQKASLKPREKELVLLSPYKGTFWGEIDKKSCLLEAGKALRKHLGQCFINSFFCKQQDPLFKCNLERKLSR